MLRAQTRGSRIASPPWNCGFCNTEAPPAPQCLTRRGLARTGHRGRGRGWGVQWPLVPCNGARQNAEALRFKSPRNGGASTTDQTRVREKCGVSFISSGSQSHSPKEQRVNGTPVRTRACLERVSPGQWLVSPGGRGPGTTVGRSHRGAEPLATGNAVPTPGPRTGGVFCDRSGSRNELEC